MLRYLAYSMISPETLSQTRESKYGPEELKERAGLIAQISDNVRSREEAGVSPAKVDSLEGSVRVVESVAPSWTIFGLQYPDETVYYKIQPDSTIRKEGFLVEQDHEIYFNDRVFSDGPASNPSLEVTTDELRHLALFACDPEKYQDQIKFLTRLPRPKDKPRSATRAFPSLSEEGASGVTEFPLFIGGIRRPLVKVPKDLGEKPSFKKAATVLAGLTDRDYFRRKKDDDPQTISRKAFARRAFINALEIFNAHKDTRQRIIGDLDQVCTMLGVSSPAEIPMVLADERRRRELSL
jgi:hypothetical protein